MPGGSGSASGAKVKPTPSATNAPASSAESQPAYLNRHNNESCTVTLVTKAILRRCPSSARAR